MLRLRFGHPGQGDAYQREFTTMTIDVPKKKPRPRLTVRAAAEMLEAPIGDITKMVRDQKYPKQGDRVFRAPFYQPSLTTVVGFYRHGKPALRAGLAKLQGIAQLPRRQNNERVLDSFTKGEMPSRKLLPVPNRRIYAKIGDVELRLSPDMQANEDGELRVVYFNCRCSEYRPETACRLLEIACHVMRLNGSDVKPDQFEFVDFFTGKVHRIKSIRQSTLDLLDDEAKQVIKVWSEV